MSRDANISETDRRIREHVRYLLRGGGAHVDVKKALADYPLAIINQQIANLPYTPWHVLEHMRLAQWDILEFSRNGSHISPKFPEGYWPPADSVADEQSWNESVKRFLSDLREMEDLLMDPTTDILAAIPHGDGQTILREALLIADHNAYHLGALMTMKKAIA